MHKVLIVDDQRDVRAMLCAGLETLDPPVSVVDVPSGEEAMLVISGQKIDLLVIDVRLPGISGLELRRRAAQMNPELKLVMITGLVDPHVRQQVISSGADAFFWKPIPMGDFLSAVQELLGHTSDAPRPGTGPLGARSAADLQELLASFNRDTGSQASLVFTDRRRVLARAGEFPLVDEPGLLAVFNKLLQTGAKAGGPLGSVRLEPVHYFHAPGCDFFLAPLDEHRSFLSVTTPSSQPHPLDEIIQLILERSPQLAAAMVERKPVMSAEETSAAASPAATGSEPAALPEIVLPPVPEDLPDTADLPSLEELFGEAAAQASETEADQFWDNLAASSEGGKVRPGDLSFEEAQELGLGPETE